MQLLTFSHVRDREGTSEEHVEYGKVSYSARYVQKTFLVGFVGVLMPGWIGAGCSVLLCSVPGPLQSVQRAETWGVVFLLRAAAAVWACR